jgi:beta-phosphoglucomutase family hydrolase
MGETGVMLRREDIDAVVFDMDGVVTKTATVHAASWKKLFDAYLREWAGRHEQPFRPFDPVVDYREYVDGKPRYDGVRDFLASRDIKLPWGDPSDPPDRETVCGLGNRKNDYFNEVVAERGVEPFESTVTLIGELKSSGFGVAMITASRNSTTILEAAGLASLFPVVVDGNVAERLGLAGKPDPAVFVEAAKELGATPARAAVVEDALAGVEAGRAGRFALVIGVDRLDHAEALREHGADVVVEDLAQVSVGD